MAKISNRDGFVLNEIKWDVQEIINHVRHEFDESEIEIEGEFDITPQVNDLFEKVDEVAIGRIIEELIETARDEARTEGYNMGYEEGQAIGRELGYDDGHDDGYGEGYDRGHEDAECDCE